MTFWITILIIYPLYITKHKYCSADTYQHAFIIIEYNNINILKPGALLLTWINLTQAWLSDYIH